MSKTARVLTVLVAIALALVLVRHFFPSVGNSVASTEALFASSFPDSEGKSQKLSQWRGKVVGRLNRQNEAYE
jgi:hypothetical protein